MPSRRRQMALLLHWMIGGMFPHDLTPLPLKRSNLLLPMRFKAGDAVVRQGEPAARFYLVRSGELEVVQVVEGEERVLRRLGAGDWFGELGLLGPKERTATVRAVTDTTVVSVFSKDFATLVDQVPALREMWGAAAAGRRYDPEGATSQRP
jgi:CRP-like cAMP-binding protein